MYRNLYVNEGHINPFCSIISRKVRLLNFCMILGCSKIKSNFSNPFKDVNMSCSCVLFKDTTSMGPHGANSRPLDIVSDNLTLSYHTTDVKEQPDMSLRQLSSHKVLL